MWTMWKNELPYAKMRNYKNSMMEGIMKSLVPLKLICLSRWPTGDMIIVCREAVLTVDVNLIFRAMRLDDVTQGSDSEPRASLILRGGKDKETKTDKKDYEENGRRMGGDQSGVLGPNENSFKKKIINKYDKTCLRTGHWI